MTQQIFISHSKDERELLNELEGIFSKAGIKQYIASFEDQAPPVSENIKKQINRSRAMMVVLGPEAYSNDVTKIWIAWEAGIALQHEIPIWIFEDVNSQVEMFIPNFTNYVLYDSTVDGQKRRLRDIMEQDYGLSRPHPLDYLPMKIETEKLPSEDRNIEINENSKVSVQPYSVECPYDECGIGFNIWFKGPKKINCPSCRKPFDISSNPKIRIRDGEFEPVLVTIDVGDTITWRNEESEPYEESESHKVVSIDGVGCDPWDFERELSESSECSYTFDSPGIYGYHCSKHGLKNECGAVLVGDVTFEGTLPCI